MKNKKKKKTRKLMTSRNLKLLLKLALVILGIVHCFLIK